MTDNKLPDPHTLAPSAVRQLQKYYQKLPAEHIIKDDYVLDIQNPSSWHASRLCQASKLDKQKLNDIWAEYGLDNTQPLSFRDVNVFEHSSISGFKIIPNLIPIQVQQVMLDRLLLRDLGIDKHQTNLHLHYHMPHDDKQKRSLFHMDPEDVLRPKYESMHKQLTVKNVLDKKLRWMTLGGQYDWTERVYPKGQPVVFPKDLERLIHGLVPSIRPEAAICNLYSPGDTLSPHRDVSEEADVSLVSMSMGCDALFLISVCEDDKLEGEHKILPLNLMMAQEAGAQTDFATQPEPNQSHMLPKHRKKKTLTLPTPPPKHQDPKTLLLRIRSGDVVVMSGESRWAWHGVPKIFADGCPKELANWPDVATDHNHVETENLSREGLEKWKGWMKSKRINLNIRQMYVYDDGDDNR